MPRSAIALVLGLLVCLLSVVLAGSALANGILVGPTGGAGASPRRGPVVLRGHKVGAVLQDRVAEVTVEQVFQSTAGRPLEGTYLFPLPEGAIVSRFAMTMGGKMVEGEVVGADEARRIYEGIVRRMRDPGLLEYVGRGLFRAKVFPIPANGEVRIRLTFQQVLPEDQGTLEFRYPLATDRFQVAPVQDVVVDVRVESSVDLKGIYSGSHGIAVSREGDRKARASYESTGRRQAKDFLLYVSRSPADVGFSLLSHRRIAEDGTFMAVIAPRVEITDEDRAPKDVVYVLDTSGSMTGEKIEQAVASLQYGIRCLHEGDRFNVVAFSTVTRALRERFLPVSAETKQAAVEWVGKLEAGGGTNIESALLEALSLRSRDRLFLVVFLTDGRPTVGEENREKLVKKVEAANEGGARIFTFGVGHDLDVHLLDRIAEATKGARDYVQPGEDIEIPTSRFFRKVDRPVMSHVKLTFGAGVHEVYPPEIGDLFAGEQVVVFGRYEEPGERTVTLTGRVGEREVKYSYPATLRVGEGPGFLPRLWAHRKIAFLLDAIRLHGHDPELQDAIVQLATRHAIVTPYTAGLVVEEHGMSGEPVILDAALSDHVETDNDLPFEGSIGKDGIRDAPFAGPTKNGLVGLGGGAGGAFGGRGGRRDLGTGGGGRRSASTAEEALKWLAAHQSPDGSWDADGFDAWCEGKPNAGERPDGLATNPSDVEATGIALAAFLGAGYTNRGRHPFAKVVSKGLRWLKNQQDAEGCFGDRAGPDFLRAHGAAALALVEAYGMTGSPIYKGSAQKALDFLALARNPGGIWGSGVRTGEDDIVTTAALVLPVRSAELINSDAVRRGKRAPLCVDAKALPDALVWVQAHTDDDYGRVVGGDGTSDLPTAIGMLIRILAGEDPRRSAAIKKSATLLATTSLPLWQPDDDAIDLSTWYYGTLALFQMGGVDWKRWNESLKTNVVDHQRRDGVYCTAKGSWDPIGKRGEAGGRVFTTALCSLCLEVYYRYDKVFGVRGAPVPPPPSTVAEQTQDSEAIRDLKKGASVAEGESDDGLEYVRKRVRQVGDKTFARHHGGRWVDTDWDGEGEPIRVEAYSDAYFALLSKAPVVARYLAVAEHVVFRLGDEIYEVVGPEETER